jgi:hypothetical protein
MSIFLLLLLLLFLLPKSYGIENVFACFCRSSLWIIIELHVVKIDQHDLL